MLGTNFRLCWETFKNNLSDGFSKLQQMEEFVDVTLAAGGHFVKAHQNIIAVASPYLKDMLKSTPCQHPVIFLGPISHTVLCFILEYIYTGEVNVPSHVLPAFVQAAKLLHIAGIKDIHLPQVNPQVSSRSSEDVNKNSGDFSTNNVSNTTQDIHDPEFNANCLVDPELNANCLIDSEMNTNCLGNHEGNIQSDNYESAVNLDESLTSQPLESNEKCDMDLDFENLIKIKTIPRSPDKDTLTSQVEQPTNTTEENVDFNDHVSISDNQIDVPSASLNNDCNDATGTSKESKEKQGNTETTDILPEMSASRLLYAECLLHSPVCPTGAAVETNSMSSYISSTPLYTRSNRGSLQMVMNRFIYYLHHTSFGKQKRRWRCINYRRQRCTAYVDTNGEIITSRKNLHNHPFQDKEILKIGRRKQFFTSLAEANNRSGQNQENNCNTGEITEKKTGQQKQYEIKIDFSKFPIT